MANQTITLISLCMGDSPLTGRSESNSPVISMTNQAQDILQTSGTGHVFLTYKSKSMDAIKLLNAVLKFSPTDEGRDWFAGAVVRTEGKPELLKDVAEHLAQELLIPCEFLLLYQILLI